MPANPAFESEGATIAAKADLRAAQVKRAKASGRSHNRGDKRTDEAMIA
jgi:hypothetical protein